MAEAFTGLANNINGEKGFIWKIWTENEETKEAGGIYLFETKEDANNYLVKHTKRLEGFGINNIKGKIFKTNDALTTITRKFCESIHLLASTSLLLFPYFLALLKSPPPRSISLWGKRLAIRFYF